MSCACVSRVPCGTVGPTSVPIYAKMSTEDRLSAEGWFSLIMLCTTFSFWGEMWKNAHANTSRSVSQSNYPNNNSTATKGIQVAKSVRYSTREFCSSCVQVSVGKVTKLLLVAVPWCLNASAMLISMVLCWLVLTLLCIQAFVQNITQNTPLPDPWKCPTDRPQVSTNVGKFCGVREIVHWPDGMASKVDIYYGKFLLRLPVHMNRAWKWCVPFFAILLLNEH